jgi:uncharacterized protein (DUF362 family)
LTTDTRREFLTKGATLAGSAALVGTSMGLLETPAACAARLKKQWRGKLVAVENSKAMRTLHKENPAVVEAMTNKALCEFTGQRTVVRAWRAVVHPSDTVGIKLNCLASPHMSTSPAMVRAIVKGLQALGIPNERIILYEQYKDQLIRRGSGFQLNEDPAKGPIVRHLGPKKNLTDTGWRGYEKNASRHGSGPSHYSNMSKICTALINVPVIKDHSLAGITGAMKNMTHGNINNPHHYHEHDCNPQIADIYAHSRLMDKVRLTVCDGLRIQYDGGPQASNRHKVLHNRIYVANDAVALDSWGLDVIERLRKKHGKQSIKKRHPTGTYLVRAQRLGLGVFDLKKINCRVIQQA